MITHSNRRQRTAKRAQRRQAGAEAFDYSVRVRFAGGLRVRLRRLRRVRRVGAAVKAGGPRDAVLTQAQEYR